MGTQSKRVGREERGGGGTKGGDFDHLDHVRSLKQTCTLLNFSMSTLKRRIEDGSIKIVHLSARRVGITDSARAAFLKQNAT
jgi:hypothetical protein